MLDGFLNVYKEQGYTSFDVVAKLRGILKQKKIGHTGTLDPMAEGVLLVCLGQATKLSEMLETCRFLYMALHADCKACTIMISTLAMML